jgi:hypothetical protein
LTLNVVAPLRAGNRDVSVEALEAAVTLRFLSLVLPAPLVDSEAATASAADPLAEVASEVASGVVVEVEGSPVETGSKSAAAAAEEVLEAVLDIKVVEDSAEVIGTALVLLERECRTHLQDLVAAEAVEVGIREEVGIKADIKAVIVDEATEVDTVGLEATEVIAVIAVIAATDIKVTIVKGDREAVVIGMVIEIAVIAVTEEDGTVGTTGTTETTMEDTRGNAPMMTADTEVVTASEEGIRLPLSAVYVSRIST